MIKLVCECGSENKLPEGWFDSGVAFNFWQMHGHFPNSCHFVCSCGEKQQSGPITNNDPFKQGALDLEFVKRHNQCFSLQ